MDITVQELKQRMDAGEELLIIDVREPHEYAAFNIGAKNIPLGLIGQSMYDYDDDLGQEIIVHCHSGARSSSAKAMLMQFGYTNVRNLLGGMVEWQMNYPK